MPRAAASVGEVLADLARVLARERVRWYVFGAQALVLRGLPRATADLDVTVLLAERPTQELVEALERGGFTSRIADPGFVAATRVLPMVHGRARLPVDVVLGGPGLEERFAEAAETMRVGRTAVPVATAPHLILMKVLAGRPKDLEDAVALLRASPAMDLAEVDALATELVAALGESDVRHNLAAVRARALAHPRAAPRARPKRRPRRS